MLKDASTIYPVPKTVIDLFYAVIDEQLLGVWFTMKDLGLKAI